MNGLLVLEDGHWYRGGMFGSEHALGGEVVFNTSATGYQEILTDPSYCGQIVVLTTAHVGNYGVNPEDVESARPQASGLIVRDYHPVPSNWRSSKSLDAYLSEAEIPALYGVDTRGLVLHIREAGALRGNIQKLHVQAPDGFPLTGHLDSLDRSHPLYEIIEEMVQKAQAIPAMAGLDLVQEVTTEESWSEGDPNAPYRVVALDFGIKKNIVRQLVQLGCHVTVVPACTTAAAILEMNPDGVLLSNGPGDPDPVEYAVKTIQELLGKVPLFGICLGHQLLGLACGGRTYKLLFGHRGGNHPVRELEGGVIEITAQNHSFALDPSSLNGREVAISHMNLNDDTVAGIRHKRYPAFSVQFHPEASPGPHDSHHLFARFLGTMERYR